MQKRKKVVEKKMHDPLFVVLYQSTLDVILVPLHMFVISLVPSTYISSVLLVTSINLSVNQSLNKIRRQVSSPPAATVTFSPFPLFSCIFLVAKHPLMMKNQGMFG